MSAPTAILPKKTARRSRKSYEARTGMNTRASVIKVSAIFTKPQMVEDADGNMVRVRKSSEMSSYSNSDIASCLVNRVAVEPGEMLDTVPPSAIKYSVTKGWLVPNENKTLYRITLKGAIELDLPLRFRSGRKIPFVGAAT